MSDDLPTPSEPSVSGWAKVGRGLSLAAKATGRAIATAYRSVDPDTRRHLAELPVTGLTLIGRGQAEIEPLPDDGHRPVLFVHGLGGRRGNFAPMRLWLKLKGRRRTYSLGLPGGEPLDALAERVRAALAEIVERNGLEAGAQVDVVAHSMGGLVVRRALQDEATVRRVATLVTLGTPHGGSHLARYAYTPHTLALRPGSEFLAGLASQLPWRGPRLVCFWSQADVILLPATTAQVDGAENVELEGVTHYGYLIYPRCWREVEQALAGRALAVARAALALSSR